MTTDALCSDRPLPTPAAAGPTARRRGNRRSFFSLLLAGAVPIDGGWEPCHGVAARGDAAPETAEEASR